MISYLLYLKKHFPLINYHVYFFSDRSETARFLLELDDSAPAGVEDNSGQAAIVWMIQKMPLVVRSNDF